MSTRAYRWRRTATLAISYSLAAGCAILPLAASQEPEHHPAAPAPTPAGAPQPKEGAQNAAPGDQGAAHGGHAGDKEAGRRGGEKGGHDDHAGSQGHLLAFSSKVNGHFQLFVWDPAASDSYAVPGAGDDVFMPMHFARNRIVFVRDTKIFYYDLTAEIVGTFNDVNELGVLRHPSISDDGRVLGFHVHAEEPDERVALWIDGALADPAKVNAVGAAHRGTHMFTIGCDGKFAAFSTIDNGLYLYDIVNPAVYEIPEARLAGNAGEQMEHIALSQDGTQVAFAKGDRLYRFDRTANLIDPLPYLNAAFDAERVQSPMFMCGDNAHLYAEAVLGERRTRIVVYNWITETLGTLTLLNSVLGDGFNAN